MQIDKQLQADCHQVGQLDNIIVLLHKNAVLPWFILVPLSEHASYRELYELPRQQREQLEQFSDALSRYLVTRGAEKINIAALGNLVAQLHLHVIGRRHDDCCWPNPVWGNLSATTNSYTEAELQKIRQAVVLLSHELT